MTAQVAQRPSVEWKPGQKRLTSSVVGTRLQTAPRPQRWLIAFLVGLVLAISLLAYGVQLGQPARVYRNASILCLGCIGIEP